MIGSSIGGIASPCTCEIITTRPRSETSSAACINGPLAPVASKITGSPPRFNFATSRSNPSGSSFELMTTSAPIFFAASRRLLSRSVTITGTAPAILAHCAVIAPTNPCPRTAHGSPSCKLERRSAYIPVWPRFQNAACFKSTPSGQSVQFNSDVTTYCACSTVATT